MYNKVNVRAIDGFMVKVSENPTETKDLLEGGFEHAYENTGELFFSKRRQLRKSFY